jgi:hypothetical protein
LNIKLFNEEQARKEAEVKLSRVNEEVEKLRAQYAQATSAGSAREAEVCTYYLLLLSVTISLSLLIYVDPLIVRWLSFVETWLLI